MLMSWNLLDLHKNVCCSLQLMIENVLSFLKTLLFGN